MCVHPLSDQQIHHISNNKSTDEEEQISQALIVIIESDFDITLKEKFFNAEHSLQNGYEDYVAPPEFDSDETNDLYSEQIGYNRGGMGWVSCIRAVNPISGKTVSCYEFGENESAFAVCSVVFESANDPEPYIVVGTAVNLNLRSGSHRGGKIHVFR